MRETPVSQYWGWLTHRLDWTPAAPIILTGGQQRQFPVLTAARADMGLDVETPKGVCG